MATRRKGDFLNDIRWFFPNSGSSQIVPGLVRQGFTIALEGDAPAGLAFAASQSVAAEAWRFATARNCPLVVHIWDIPPWRVEGGNPDPIWFVGGRFLRLPIPGVGYPERPGYYSRLRYIARRALEVWTPSKVSAELVERFFQVSSRQVAPCYDSARFVADPSVPRSNVLVTVSRLVRSKNQAAVLRAAALLEPRRPVRLIGRGPEALPLAMLADRLGVPCSIEQDVSDAGVAEAYQRAGVVVSASRFEGFGLTPMEAIGCGAATAVSDIPAHREFLQGVPAYFPLDDDQALAAAIRRAEERPPATDALVGRLGLESGTERYGIRFATLLGRSG